MKQMNALATAPATDYDPGDVDVFVRVLNGEILQPVNTQKTEWEDEVQQCIDTLCYWGKRLAIAAATITILGFSVIGMIATVVYIAAG